jgi:hypothetical protein
LSYKRKIKLSQANGTAIIAIAVRVGVMFVKFANVTRKDLGITNTGNAFHAHKQTKKKVNDVKLKFADAKNIISKK